MGGDLETFRVTGSLSIEGMEGRGPAGNISSFWEQFVCRMNGVRAGRISQISPEFTLLQKDHVIR